MGTGESVLWSFNWLLDVHRAELSNSQQVNCGLLPGAGHGDDIWVRTERLHVIAEVTLSGLGSRWTDVVGPKRQIIVAKIDKLRDRIGVTHKYLFVSESIAVSIQGRYDIGDVQVVAIPA